LNNCKEAKDIFYLAEEIRNINEKLFKCPIAKCEKKDRWTKMANHVLKYRAGEEYEVNIGEWGGEFMAKFEKPYEIMEGWEEFVKSKFEKEVIANNITFEPSTPSHAQEQPSTSKQKKTEKKTVGYYISARGNLHSIDLETESDEGIYVTTELKEKLPAEEKQIRVSEKSFRKLKLEVVAIPKEPVTKGSRDDDLRKKRRRSEKYIKARKQRRH